MAINLEGHAPLKESSLFVVAFNPQRSWRIEMRAAAPAEVQHYLNCDWPSSMWGFSQIFELTDAQRPLDDAFTIEKVIDVTPVSALGTRIGHVIQGPCPRELHSGEQPMTITYIIGTSARVRSGDLLLPVDSMKEHELVGLIRPSIRHLTATETRRYAACDWPTWMKQP